MNKKDWALGMAAIAGVAALASFYARKEYHEESDVKEQSVVQPKGKNWKSLEERLTGVFAHNGVYVEVYSKGEYNSKLVYKIDPQNKRKYSGLGEIYMTISNANLFEKGIVSLDLAVEHQTLTFNHPQKLSGKEFIIYAVPEGNYIELDKVKLGGK